MFQIEDKSLLGCWNLSNHERRKFEIPEDRMKYLGHHDMLAINFLYQNYQKECSGVILNEQNGFNMQLQVSAFLNVLYRNVDKLLTLIIAPEYTIEKWQHYLIDIAGLKPIIINEEICSEDFGEQHGVALISSFDHINLLEDFTDVNFFCVVIDCLEEVVKKAVIKKIYGKYLIGLTNRNFYLNPDQRLQWMMLNWCSPGCCGESKNFSKIDNDNYANFRDNYRHWWFRLTTHFCDSFKDIVGEEKVKYKKVTELQSLKPKSTTSRKTVNRKPRKNKSDTKGKGSDTEAKSCSNSNSLNLDVLLKEEVESVNSFSIAEDDPINLLFPSSSNLLSVHLGSFSEQHEFKSEQDPLSQSNIEDLDSGDDKNNILLSLLGEGDQMEHKDVCDPENEESVERN